MVNHLSQGVGVQYKRWNHCKVQAQNKHVFLGAIFVDSWSQVSLIREIQKLYHVTNLF